MSLPLSRSMKNYITAFLWLAIALAVVSIVHLSSIVIPQQDLIIGGYVTTTVPVVVNTTTVTYTHTVTTTNVSPYAVFSLSIAHTVQNPTYTLAPPGIYVVNPSPLTTVAYVEISEARQGVIVPLNGFRRLVVNVNSTPYTTITARQGEYNNCGFGFWCDYVWLNIPNVNLNNSQVIVNSYTVYNPPPQTISTSVPVTVTTQTTTHVNTTAPADNSIVISNRAFIDIIAFAVFVLMAIVAVNKLIKLRI